MQKTDILVCKHIYRIRCQRQFKHLTSLRLCRCRDDVARVIDTVRILRLCRLQHSPHSLAARLRAHIIDGERDRRSSSIDEF